MILNGKCKEDFFKWNKEKEYYVSEYALRNDLISPILVNALIIDFFDSVGIHIYLSTGSYVSIPNFKYTIITQDDTCEGLKENTREEADKQAIIKANNIYNGE